MNQNIIDGLALLGMFLVTLVYSLLARRRHNDSNLDDFMPEDHHERRVWRQPDDRKVVSMLEERLAWCSVRACLP